MDSKTAIEVWGVLEGARETELEGDPPVYDVRLDAATASETGERYYTLRVTPARGMGGLTRDDWLYVTEQAVEHELDLDVDNSALVLR